MFSRFYLPVLFLSLSIGYSNICYSQTNSGDNKSITAKPLQATSNQAVVSSSQSSTSNDVAVSSTQFPYIGYKGIADPAQAKVAWVTDNPEAYKALLTKQQQAIVVDDKSSKTKTVTPQSSK